MPPRRLTAIPRLISAVAADPGLALRSLADLLRGERRLYGKIPTLGTLSSGRAAAHDALRAHLITRDEWLRTPAWKRRTLELLSERVNSENDHGAATSELVAIVSELSPSAQRSQQFFALAKATRSIGLFEASLGFTNLAYDRVEQDATNRSDAHIHLRSVLVAIHRRKRSDAIERWTAVQSVDSLSAPTLRLHKAVARYMGIWALDSPTTTTTVEPTMWSSDLAGKRVVLIGPAPTDSQLPDVSAYDFVVRILRGPSLHLPAVPPVAANEILYSATGWYGIFAGYDPDELKERFGKYRYFVTKGRAPSLSADLENLRVTSNDYRLLFLDGHPNMVPVASMDILEAGSSVLHLSGTNFYASKEPYAPGSIDRLSHYEMTRALSSHNPLENRAIVANLADYGLISGDESFEHAASLTDLEYMKVLDAHLGKPQR